MEDFIIRYVAEMDVPDITAHSSLGRIRPVHSLFIALHWNCECNVDKLCSLYVYVRVNCQQRLFHTIFHIIYEFTCRDATNYAVLIFRNKHSKSEGK